MGYRSDVAYSIRFAQYDDVQIKYMAEREEKAEKSWQLMLSGGKLEVTHDISALRRYKDSAYEFAERFNKEAKALFYVFLAEAKVKPETSGVFNELGMCDSSGEGFFIDESKLAINFLATDVKWYPDYIDVKCHEALLDLANTYISSDSMQILREFEYMPHKEQGGIITRVVDAEGGVSSQAYECLGFMFNRIGENMEDIEERCNGEYDSSWCEISRQIIVDWA